jgi:short-subunit dehydrogenase
MIKQYQTALVTGASRGIGPYIVRALAKEKLNLVLAARSRTGLEQIEEEVQRAGVQAVSVPTDLTSPEARLALVSQAKEAFGIVDVLVNNAGGDPQRHFHLYEATDVEQVLQLNLVAPLELSRLLLPDMLRQGRGHIVSIGSIAGSMGFPLTEVYAAAKDGLVGFTRLLRADYGPEGIGASLVILGTILGAGATTDTVEELGIQLPLAGRLFASPPGAVAAAVVKALRRDKAELVVMPGPGKLTKTMLDLFPGMGPWINRLVGMEAIMHDVAAYREDQRTQLAARRERVVA